MMKCLSVKICLNYFFVSVMPHYNTHVNRLRMEGSANLWIYYRVEGSCVVVLREGFKKSDFHHFGVWPPRKWLEYFLFFWILDHFWSTFWKAEKLFSQFDKNELIGVRVATPDGMLAALRSMSAALCSMLVALRSMLVTLRSMSVALRSTAQHVGCTAQHVGCTAQHVSCTMRHVSRTTWHVGCTTWHVGHGMLAAQDTHENSRGAFFEAFPYFLAISE